MDNRIERARQLRKDMPQPEIRLWRKLRARQLFGLKFKRQVPIGPYIVDFMCEEFGLIVEVDGETHAFQIAYDRRRDAFLNTAGFFVLRLSNNEVVQNLEGALSRIAMLCRK